MSSYHYIFAFSPCLKIWFISVSLVSIYRCWIAYIELGSVFGAAEVEEVSHFWCLQPLDSPDNRLVLPGWIGNAIELQVCIFVTEHGDWQKKIAKRSAEGKELTKSQKEKFQAWELRCEPRLVFSKDKKKQLTDAKQIRRDKSCVALQLHLSDEPERLQVTASNGERFQLLLLKGHQCTGKVPEVGLCIRDMF